MAASVALVACSGGSESLDTSPTPPAPPPVSPTVVTATTPVPPPDPPALPPPTAGPTTTDCVNGWRTPERGTRDFELPLRVIRRTTGVEGPLEVVDMRYFEGPESPPSDKGYIKIIRRWYVKLWAERDPAFQGRFLVEARWFGSGVAAVAPYDTNGWRSPDWIGFQYESADTERRTYPGLPGAWAGEPYDFVKGGGGIDIPGLPQEVVGCLDGT